MMYVVNNDGEVVFEGTTAECSDYAYANGGFVKSAEEILW